MKASDSIGSAERCRLPQSTMDALGVQADQQVRLVYDGEAAVFTVDISDDTFGYVSNSGRDRLRAKNGSFRVEGRSDVIDSNLDEETAKAEGGFIEQTTESEKSELAVLAPHGGYIEWGTDTQAERMTAQLDATKWCSSGWSPGGGAFRRWHVTSTAIHPESFPALQDISDRGFDHAVAFHGWSESHVGIGGAAPTWLRADVRDAISEVVDCDVRLATDGSRDGDSPDNVVNWITESGSDGVQIEQPWAVRDDRRDTVADAVAGVFEAL
ncbi:poly-gamma-glutamate hydrolase family protein [Haloarcula sp. NS06]|uniref:poly-gamma-glutamate hydrolase family protein n=1 Tax=unclassified Haloarcula TaxID=2624677 RepID=UPI0027B2BBFA|nr:poly-gamma-glutamate hydrolase family protein [Haloarcula sp. H-GB4]MDQ2072403.1 poly-gamma-glutamate hydrolase family protein [Haloarcula sp. H-GB4]